MIGIVYLLFALLPHRLKKPENGLTEIKFFTKTFFLEKLRFFLEKTEFL